MNYSTKLALLAYDNFHNEELLRIYKAYRVSMPLTDILVIMRLDRFQFEYILTNTT